MKLNTIKLGVHALEDITELAKENKISLIDAIQEYCNKKGIELEYIPTIIKRSEKFKAALLEEAVTLNLIKAK
jgi:hypothetical protein